MIEAYKDLNYTFIKRTYNKRIYAYTQHIMSYAMSLPQIVIGKVQFLNFKVFLYSCKTP